MGLKLMLVLLSYTCIPQGGFVGHSMKQYVNYLSPGNHKFDRELKLLLGLFLNVFDNVYDMIFEIDAALMKALAQETTADCRFPS